MGLGGSWGERFWAEWGEGARREDSARQVTGCLRTVVAKRKVERAKFEARKALENIHGEVPSVCLSVRVLLFVYFARAGGVSFPLTHLAGKERPFTHTPRP